MDEFKSTQYLYGLDPKQLTGLLYLDTLTLKKESSKALIKELYVDDLYARDDKHINAVVKAQKLTEVLIKEIS